MTVLLAIESKLDLNSAPSSRVIWIRNYLVDQNLETSLLCYKGSYLSSNGNLVQLKAPQGSILLRLSRRFHFFFSFAKIIFSGRFEFIITRGFYLGFISLIVCKLLGKKSIYDFHGFVAHEQNFRGEKLKPFLTKILEYYCINFSNLVISQRKSNLSLIGKSNQKILLENGVERISNLNKISKLGDILLRKYKIDRKKKIVGFIGNWEAWMNIKDILDCSVLSKEFEFIIIGKSKNFDIYRAKYSNIVFTGRLSWQYTMALLSKFDFAVCPYLNDPIIKFKASRKIKEYIYFNKPVIVSDTKYRESFLVKNKTCILYEGGSPSSLLSAIHKISENTVLRRNIISEYKILKQNFLWKNILSKCNIISTLKDY